MPPTVREEHECAALHTDCTSFATARSAASSPAIPFRRLAAMTERLGAVLTAGHDVYAYFNNDWDGHAVTDATSLRAALGGHRP